MIDRSFSLRWDGMAVRAAAALGLFAIANAECAAQHVMRELPSLGGTWRAQSVDASGSVICGTAWDPAAGQDRAVWWDMSGSAIHVLPPLGTSPWIYDISPDGAFIVGRAFFSGQQRAIKWNRTGGYTQVLSDFGASASATGVSPTGITVGAALSVPNSIASEVALWWNSSGSFFVLPSFGGPARAWGVTDNNFTIVGEAFDPPSNRWRAVFWHRILDMMIALPDLGSHSSALAVTATGDTIIGSVHDPVTSRRHAARWRRTIGLSTYELNLLPPMGHYTYLEATGIGNDMVVGRGFDPQESRFRAVIWKLDDGSAQPMLDVGYNGTRPVTTSNGAIVIGDNVWVFGCPADITGDGVVNATDLSVLLAQWRFNIGELVADINRDGVVDGLDLSIVLGCWGPCPDIP